jgi:hypothetical protein
MTSLTLNLREHFGTLLLLALTCDKKGSHWLPKSFCSLPCSATPDWHRAAVGLPPTT